MTDDLGDLGPGEFYPVVGVGPYPKPWPVASNTIQNCWKMGIAETCWIIIDIGQLQQ